ncbi:DUF736 domain-containing protein [bacterium]|nr:DUF736 domain-containing protein [bacterium]
MSDVKKDWDKLEIGALWKRQSKANNPYYSGKLEVDGKKYEVVCFPNTNKKEDKHPDVRIYLSEQQ